MFTAFTSSEKRKSKKRIRQKKDISLKKKEKPISSNVDSKPNLEMKTYKEPCDLSEYG